MRLRIDLRPDGFYRSFDAADNERVQTFEETWERSSRIASGLRDHGIVPGRTILLLQQDILDFAPAFWACVRAGYVAVPFTAVSIDAQRTDVRKALQHLERPVLLADSLTASIGGIDGALPSAPLLYLDRVERAPLGTLVPCTERRVVCLVPTSGSTGTMKLVALDTNALLHRYFSASITQAPQQHQARLGTFPFDSITGLAAVFANFASWTQASRRTLATRPDTIFDLIGRFGITHVQATNSLANRLVAFEEGARRTFALSSLAAFDLGGETVTRTVAARLAAALARHGAMGVLGAGYGTTETGPLLEGDDPSTSPIDRCGGVQLGGCAPGVCLRIVDDDGRLLDEGQIGNVEVSCQQKIFTGYAGEPVPSASTEDGWWKTGDLGMIEDGAFAFHGRAKQVLVAAGRKFSLVDIDAQIEPPADAGCRAISFIARAPVDATDRLGVALILEREEVDSALVRESVRQAALRHYGLEPDFVTLPIAELPLTATGKIDRTQLSAIGDTPSPEQTRAPLAPQDASFLEKVGAIWREIFGRDIGPDVDFFDAGGDSFGLVRLQLEWERAFGAAVDVEAFQKPMTIGTMSAATMAATPIDNTQNASANFADAFIATQRRLMSSWPGVPVTDDGLIHGRHSRDSASLRSEPAICAFWIMQDGGELQRLLDGLPDIDVFGLRSGHLILNYESPDFYEVVALYINALRQVQPRGPYYLGGICQGALIAVSVARSLQALGEEVRLLTIVEFDIRRAFRSQPYFGNVAALFGRWSRVNPRRHFVNLDEGWRRLLPAGVRLSLFDGNHFFLNDAFTADVARAIVEAHEAARDPGPVPLAQASICSTDYDCAIEITAPPSAMCGETLTIEVAITNSSLVTWDAYAQSGIAVANHWLDVDGGIIVWHDASAGLPDALAPGQRCVVTLNVTVPRASGRYALEVDLVEQGVAWFKEQGEDTRSIATALIEAKAPEAVVERSLFGEWTKAFLRKT